MNERRRERRRSRRSSPDAPQGYVAVATVVAGLAAIIVVAGIGLGSPGSDRPRTAATGSTLPNGAGDLRSTATSMQAPTTGLIRGSTTTMLFVTTTTPITTTTSTTTTTLPGPALDAGGAEIVFTPGQRSVTFTVRSASPDGIDFLVTGVPRGMAVTPTAATVSETSPVTITLRITDPSSARAGTIVLVGSDGSRASIRVRIDDGSLSITAVSFDPNPPTCGTRSRVVAFVSGDSVRSVTATVTSGGSRLDLSMSEQAAGTWVATLPDGAAGSTITGVVTAAGSDGGQATKSFASTFVGGPSCTG